jgi:formamidase
VRTIHHVHPERYHHGWSNAFPPALEVAPGSDVHLTVRDASGGQLGETSTVADVGNVDFARVNPVSGPIAVTGARPGDVLSVEILELAPSGWGWTAIIPGFGLLADEYPDPWLRISTVSREGVRFSDRITLPFAPFPGTIGVAPAEPGEHSIVPPRRWGGNVDIKHLRPGTTLYLPVGVDGALLSIGDTHACQGDGEVCGTAVESAMELTVRVDVRRDLRLDAPALDVPAGWQTPAETARQFVTTGVGPDLMEASRDAVRAAIGWLGEHRGLDREEAYAFCSVACDLRVHEVVDMPNWVVGCWIPLNTID